MSVDILLFVASILLKCFSSMHSYWPGPLYPSNNFNSNEAAREMCAVTDYVTDMADGRTIVKHFPSVLNSPSLLD